MFSYKVAVIFIGVSTFLLTVCHCARQEEKLLGLFVDDTKFFTSARPVVSDLELVNVTLDLALQQIIALDERQETLLISVRQVLSWRDVRLTWDPEDHQDVEILHLPADKLWRPDIVLYNSADQSDAASREPTTSYVLVTSNGSVTWSQSSTVMTSSCHVDIRWFPFDDQSCELRFGSASYDVTELSLQPIRDKIDTPITLRNNQWHLKDMKAELQLDETGSHEMIVYKIHLTRRSSYYVVNLIIPSCTLTLLTLFSFYLPPQSGQKVTLGVIVLLALSLYQLVLAGMIPTMSSSLPLISAYFCTLTTLCTLSLIMTIFVINLHYTQPSDSPTPYWVHIGVCKCLAWLLCMNYKNKKKKRNMSKVKLKSYRPNLVFHVTKSTPNDTNNSNEIPSEESHTIEVRQDPPYPPGISTDTQVVLDELRLMNKRLRENVIKREQREEWEFAARVIDRLCFCISSFIFIVCMAGIFLLMATDHITSD